MVTSIEQDLRVQPLSGKVKSGLSKDSDGFYIKRGVPVYISGDGEFAPCTDATKFCGVTESSVHEDQVDSTGPDSRSRVAVLTKYTYLLRATAGAECTYNQDLQLDATGTKYVPVTDPSTQVTVAKCFVGGLTDATIKILI